MTEKSFASAEIFSQAPLRTDESASPNNRKAGGMAPGPLQATHPGWDQLAFVVVAA